MYNVHLNGDIVLSTGNAALDPETRIARGREHFKCKFNKYVAECEHVQEHIHNWDFKLDNHLSDFKPGSKIQKICPFECDPFCPGRVRLSEISRKKTYRIDYKHYRRIVTSCIKAIHESPYKMIFFTLTFPKYKKHEITDQAANNCFSNFMDNLRTNYNTSHYVAVRERGTINNRLHYHCLVTLPFVNFNRLNLAWCKAISEYCEYSRNAISTDPKNRVITSTVGSSKYFAKYFNSVRKNKQCSDTRIIFISHRCRSDSRRLTEHEVNTLLSDYSFEIRKLNDYTYYYNVDDYNSFLTDRIFELFNYPARGQPVIHNKN